MIRDILDLALRLMLVCAVAAAGLGLTYGAVKSNIAKMEREEREEGARKVLEPAGLVAEEDAELLSWLQGDFPDLQGVFRGKDGSGGTGGYAFVVKSKGYNFMTLAVGVDSQGKIIGVATVKQEETPGLGSVPAQSEEYLSKYKGLGPEPPALKKDVDAWNGATFTSSGINKGVQMALEAFRELSGEGGGKR
jgi:electron transport complex protein RnfG